MRRTVFPPDAQDQSPSSSLQHLISKIPRISVYRCNLCKSTGFFFSRQKRGSSRPCKNIPRYPHDSRMRHKVMHDLHDRDCSRASDIQHMYPQAHSLHGLWDVWQRPRDTQVLYENEEYTTICDGLPRIRYDHWGWEEKPQSPLCSSQKNPNLVTNYSYLGWAVCIFHMKRFLWQMPVSKPYRTTHGHSGPFRRRWQTCRKVAQCAVAAPLAGCSN